VQEWFDRWWPTVNTLRPSTRARDEAAFHNHIAPVFGSMPLARVDRTSLREWVAKLSDPEGSDLAPATVTKAVQVFNKTMRAVVDDRLLATNPVERLPLPRIVREDEGRRSNRRHPLVRRRGDRNNSRRPCRSGATRVSVTGRTRNQTGILSLTVLDACSGDSWVDPAADPRPPPHSGLTVDRGRSEPEAGRCASWSHQCVCRARPLWPPLPSTGSRPHRGARTTPPDQWLASRGRDRSGAGKPFQSRQDPRWLTAVEVID
jgi:hypothetical protein